MSTPALARLPAAHFDRAYAPMTADSGPAIGQDGRDVYQIVARQLPYVPYAATAHWRRSGEALAWSLFAMPCGAAVAAGMACASFVAGGVMAAGALVSAGVGCVTVVLAPVLVPTSVCLALYAANAVVWGGLMAGATMGLGAAVSVYQGMRAVGHASRALAEEMNPFTSRAA